MLGHQKQAKVIMAAANEMCVRGELVQCLRQRLTATHMTRAHCLRGIHTKGNTQTLRHLVLAAVNASKLERTGTPAAARNSLA